MAGQSRMIFFSFSFSMTSFEVNYNADASSHFSWSHPNFFFLSLVVLKLMRRDFFHSYKQVRISASMFINNNNNNNNNNYYINDQSCELFFIREILQDCIC